MKPKPPERRQSTLRRQFNQSFLDGDGNVVISKVVAVAAQTATLLHFGRSFDALIDRPEALLIILSFLVAPDFVKKFITMKYGK